MLSASKQYKEIMNRKIRNRAYISIALGVTNQEAGQSASIEGEYIPWSDNEYPFSDVTINSQYATFEENFLSADGEMYFLPEDEDTEYLFKKGVTTNNIGEEIRIDFDNRYNVRGLTLLFEKNCYPTEFELITETKTIRYSNNLVEFKTSNILGITSYIIIRPITMLGGQQRFRLNKVGLGINLNFGNDEVKDFSLEEFVHSISEELPSITATLNVLDKDNRFNVDDEDSYINFFEAGQKATVKCGLELDNGDIEWLNIGVLSLSEWNSQKGSMQLTLKDKLSLHDDTYSAGNTIRERSLYDDAIAVLNDMGLEEKEYEVDQYLKTVIVTNPLPEASHAECLQIIANAGRCILCQKIDGRISIRANFANLVDEEDIIIEGTEYSELSKIDNIKYGSQIVYADMTQNFFSANGTMYFPPDEGQEILETGFISKCVSDSEGYFEINPTITITLPAGYIYHGVFINFDGNPAQEVNVKTYYYDMLQEDLMLDVVGKEAILTHEFRTFDKMVIEFTKATPNNRILVNKVAFGDLTDYVLTKDNVYSQPKVNKEEQKKEVRVKIFTFENGEDGTPQEVDDNVFVTQTLNDTGTIVTFENSLISTEEHALQVAEWIGNHYKNNVSYSIEGYRGEPRIQATDIMYLENDFIPELKVEVNERKFTFNGAFGGSLELRKALKLVEE